MAVKQSRSDMRKLTIVSVAYPFAPVGLNAVGGAEQVLTAIDRALVQSGHRSLVIAVEKSATFGEFFSYPPPDQARMFDDFTVAEQRRRAGKLVQHVLNETVVDVVHMHGIDFHHYLPSPGPQVLATLHLPLAWYPAHALLPARPSTWLNCVSDSQATYAGPNPRMLPPIINGVAVNELRPLRMNKQSYALMLARICPEKGQHLALEAAHTANATLLIGGEVFPYPTHQDYFADRVKPLLDERRRFLGPVGFARKHRLLAGARCLLVPSLVAETSSLVVMEAASCGTPVIAFRSGALPELVEHGRSGFVVDDVESMVTAMRQIDEIDPETCRAIALERFQQDRMTTTYIDRYFELARSTADGAG